MPWFMWGLDAIAARFIEPLRRLFVRLLCAHLPEPFKHVQLWPAAPIAKAIGTQPTYIWPAVALLAFGSRSRYLRYEKRKIPLMRTRLFWFSDFCWPQQFPPINPGVGPRFEADLRGAALCGWAAEGEAREAKLLGPMPPPPSDAV